MNLVRELGCRSKSATREIWEDAAKWRCYQEADLIVLPSYSENFGWSLRKRSAAVCR